MYVCTINTEQIAEILYVCRGGKLINRISIMVQIEFRLNNATHFAYQILWGTTGKMIQSLLLHDTIIRIYTKLETQRHWFHTTWWTKWYKLLGFKLSKLSYIFIMVVIIYEMLLGNFVWYKRPLCQGWFLELSGFDFILYRWYKWVYLHVWIAAYLETCEQATKSTNISKKTYLGTAN